MSNSASQREHIEAEVSKRGLKNLRVVTSDMNVFDPMAQFDRIVSIEMFEHMELMRNRLMGGSDPASDELQGRRRNGRCPGAVVGAKDDGAGVGPENRLQ